MGPFTVYQWDNVLPKHPSVGFYCPEKVSFVVPIGIVISLIAKLSVGTRGITGTETEKKWRLHRAIEEVKRVS